MNQLVIIITSLYGSRCSKTSCAVRRSHFETDIFKTISGRDQRNINNAVPGNAVYITCVDPEKLVLLQAES